MYRHSGLLSKGQRGGGRQCIDTQDLYLKVRGEVGTQCTDTQDLYQKVMKELGTSWYTLTGLLSKGQMRGGNTV